ncbi:unnamed protein product [Parnassius mnemosyne]|uniref:RNA-directed DNA polymerase n=2 Tax=Parnassius mnemosyne TaxID=213953 RepID=A0AAV1LPG9_9NEOP
MPMGLKTSPNSFSRMMNMAMAGLTFEKCFIYLDDIIIFGRNLADHNKNLTEVFERLKQVNLKLNPDKCTFKKKELLYLGHVVSGDGVLPDPEKIKVIQNYPIPTNTDEIKRFVAFANFYRKFIPNFAEKAFHLNRLCRKNVQFYWSDECQRSFNALQQDMMSPPLLQYPDFSENNQFIVQTDASGYVIGAVLSNKNGKPIAYASRTLNRAEKNYPTIEKELLSVVWAVKYFRPYLYGRSFKIYTDHKPLIYLFNMKDPSSRLLKFRLALEEYDYIVEYVRGSENAAADALSRIRITSKDLTDMSECSVNVMTRAQKKMEEKCSMTRKNCDSLHDIVNTDNWLDHPRVVEELLVMLSTLLRGSVYERLRWAFRLYDVDGDGAITRQELAEVVVAVHELLGRRAPPGSPAGRLDDAKANEQVDRVFRKLDLNQDGVITIEEFLESCLKDDVITRSLQMFDTGL